MYTVLGTLSGTPLELQPIPSPDKGGKWAWAKQHRPVEKNFAKKCR